MFRNYITIAWRQILKNKVYASINILGLVVGLTVYIFGSLLISYERSHDTFYKKYERIFTAGSIFSSTAGVGVGETDVNLPAGAIDRVGELLEALFVRFHHTHQGTAVPAAKNDASVINTATSTAPPKKRFAVHNVMQPTMTSRLDAAARRHVFAQGSSGDHPGRKRGGADRA